MLKGLKRGGLLALRDLGVMGAVARSSWRQKRLLILCYHSLSVDQEHQWKRALFFTPEEFDERLELIEKHRLNVLTLEEGIRRLREGTLPDRSAILTFDDGTADFHDLVAPRLRRLGYPATVYVSTYYIDKGLPIFPLMISYVLWKGRHQHLGPDPDFGLNRAIDLSTREGRMEVERAIIARVTELGLSAGDRDAVAGRLAGRLGVDHAELGRRRVLQLMTPQEIASVAGQGFDVQLHTHRHRTPDDQQAFTEEILENRRRIEAMTGRAARHFCYPSGVYFPPCLGWLNGLGVVSGTTCVPGLATAESPSLLLPRLVDTAGLSPVELEGWLSGLSSVLPRRRTS
jgi:peptidoglycan/xylan/chitin deacetylase (PgdA/CDA1 family)